MQLQGIRHLAKQLVAGGMAAGVVDDLELVEVEEHQRMLAALAEVLGLQRLFQTMFELAAIGQLGQAVVRGLP
jgi:hypothetical protein